MRARQELERSIHQFLNYNRDGSYATQADRRHILLCFAHDLFELNYKIHHVRNLKTKHITAVLAHWKSQGLANSTLKNRMSVLRHLTTKINKANIIGSNQQLDIPARSYVPKFNRAVFCPDFKKISDIYVRHSLELQRVFGLRREESLKIKPWHADLGDKLKLQPSWCKGGRGREVPIRTAEQREWLDKAKELVKCKKFSLIPEWKSYKQHLGQYKKQLLEAKLKKMHGLRHAYAQLRYKELTGREAPINGGLTSKELTTEQKQQDYAARMIISAELGHCRESITVQYCSR